MDKVKPLKMETVSETDYLPTEVDYTEDYITAKGFSFENLDTVKLDKDASDNIILTDPNNGASKLKELRTAINNIFDNSTNGFTATEVQSAIVEAKTTAVGKVRFTCICGYGGQAKGQYLEFFKGIASSTSPFIVPLTAKVKEVSISLKTGFTPVGTIILCKNGTALRTFTPTQAVFYETGLSLDVTVGDKLCAYGDNNSGTTLIEPVMVVYMQVV